MAIPFWKLSASACMPEARETSTVPRLAPHRERIPHGSRLRPVGCGGPPRRRTPGRERRHIGSLVTIDTTLGHEQRDKCRCIAVCDPKVVENQNNPLIAVVPVTPTAGEGALYPALDTGESGLKTASYALVDQVRSVDKRRIHRLFGRISQQELRAVDEGLWRYLGLG